MRPDGLVGGAVYVDADGAEHEVRAGVTTLCANGIGTPRLLLVSGGGDGLANSSGLVGRRLMMHPFGTVVGVFERTSGRGRGRGASSSTRSSSTRRMRRAGSCAGQVGLQPTDLEHR
jgi:choline dehydrogenase-like flavoprotein